MEERIEEAKIKNVFKNRNFTLVFLGALVSNIASLFYAFSVSFYILKLSGNNAFIQGLYLAIGGIVFCIVTLFGGVISDRYNKAKIMYSCDYVKGITIIVFTLLMMFVVKSNTAKIVILFVVTIIGNTIAGIFSPASSALLPLIIEENQYQQAQSYFSILSSLQSIVGFILAGILYSLVPINILFLIVGGCYILSAISEMFIKYNADFENKTDKLSLGIIFGDIKEGFKYLVSMKAILSLMICILFINFFFSPIFENFTPYFIATDLTGTNYLFNKFVAPEMWNSFFSMAFGIGSLITSIILSNTKPPEKSNKLIRYAMMGVSILMMAMTLIYFFFVKKTITINVVLITTIFIVLLIGVLVILINVPASSTMMKVIDKDKFGKVSSVSNIGSQGLIPLSLFLGGLAITYLTPAGLLTICSIGLLVVSTFLFFNKKVREL